MASSQVCHSKVPTSGPSERLVLSSINLTSVCGAELDANARMASVILSIEWHLNKSFSLPHSSLICRDLHIYGICICYVLLESPDVLVLVFC